MRALLLIAPLLLGAAQSTGKVSPTGDVSNSRVTATGSTTARALRDRYPWFDPRDFGAHRKTEQGYSAFDSREAIQAAIDAANTAGGGTVAIDGKYNVGCSGGAGLVLKAGVTLFNPAGQAERSNASNPSAGGLYYLSGTGSCPMVTVGVQGQSTGAMQTGIKGVSLINASGTGVVVNAQAFTAEGISVLHPIGHGFELRTGTANLLNTHVIGPGKTCIYVTGNDNRIGAGFECQQPNSTDGGASEPLNTWDGIYISSVGSFQVAGIRMGDDAYKSRDCIRVQNGGNVQIVNSDLQNCTQAGVYLEGGNTFSVTGTNIASASTSPSKVGVKIGTGTSVAKHITIAGNTFNGIVAGGIGGISVDASDGPIVISGNTFFGNWAGAAAIVGSTSSITYAENGGAGFGTPPTMVDPTGAAVTARLYQGAGAPNNANGADGDFALRTDGSTSTGRLYLKSGGAWVGLFTPYSLRNFTTIDVASMAAGTCASDADVTVTGALTGSECVAGAPSALPGSVQLNCFVSAADSVKLRICNNSAGPVDPPQLTYNVRVFNP
jgi:hypothetical protein